LHSKVFIVDDSCIYVGSQNLYSCDLCEFGVVIDDKQKTADIMESFWTPLWENSHLDESKINPDKVMEILGVDRDPTVIIDLSE